MEENKNNVAIPTKVGPPPVGFMANQYCYHLGIILSNLSIIFLLLSVSGIASILLPVFFWCLLLIITIYTIGTIYLYYPRFASLWGWGVDMLNFGEKIMMLFPLFITLTFATAIASLVLLLINKNKRHYGRIVFSASLIGLAIVVVLGVLLGVIF